MEDHEQYIRDLGEWFSSDALCKKDARSQIAFLSKHSNPAFWHVSALQWDWHADIAVLEWMLNQPNCDFSTACFVLVHDGSNDPFDRYPETDHFRYNILNKIRSKFYAGPKFGLGEYAGSFRSSLKGYQRNVEQAKEPTKWALPSEAYGPFSGDWPEHGLDFMFDDGSQIRKIFSIWKRERGMASTKYDS